MQKLLSILLLLIIWFVSLNVFSVSPPTFAEGSYNPNVTFLSTANATVTNTTVETSIIGTGVGSLVIPANYLKVGKAYEIDGEGVYSTPMLPGNATIRIKLNSVVIASATAPGSLLTANSNNYGCSLKIILTVRSIGVNGTIITNGAGDFTLNPTTGSNARLDFNNAGATTTINTTIANTIDVTNQWSNAQVGQTLIGTQALIRELN